MGHLFHRSCGGSSRGHVTHYLKAAGVVTLIHLVNFYGDLQLSLSDQLDALGVIAMFLPCFILPFYDRQLLIPFTWRSR